MWCLSAWMARYWNWNVARAEAMPRWQGYAIIFGSVVACWVFMVILPGWLQTIFVCVVPPLVLTFWQAHTNVWKKRDEVKTDQRNAVRKTQKLLKNSRFGK